MDTLVWATDTMIFAAIAGGALILLLLALLLGEVLEIFEADVESPVNTHTVLGFLTGFGASAFVASGYYQTEPVISALIGLAFGIPVGLASFGIIRALKGQEADSGHSLSDVVGETAVVYQEIPRKGAGKVRYNRHGATYTALARSQDGSSVFPVGTRVMVQDVSGTELFVSTAPELESITGTPETERS